MKELELQSNKVALELYYTIPERTSIDGVTKTKGGIVLTDALKKDNDLIEYKSHPWVGRVVASGSDFYKIGDIVYLSVMTGVLLDKNPQSFDVVIYKGSDLFIMPDVRILCRDNSLSLKDYKRL